MRQTEEQLRSRVEELEKAIYIFLETFAGTSDCDCEPPGSDGDGFCTGVCYLREVQNR